MTPPRHADTRHPPLTLRELPGIRLAARIAQSHGHTLEELQGARRYATLVEARYIALLALYDGLGHTHAQLAAIFHYQGPSSATRALQLARNLLQVDRQFHRAYHQTLATLALTPQNAA